MSEEISCYDAVISDLERKREQALTLVEQASTLIEKLKQFRAFSTTTLTAASQISKPSPVTEIPRDTLAESTISVAAKELLKTTKCPTSTDEIATALECGGLERSSQDLSTTVHSALGKQREDSVEVGGNCALLEWCSEMRNQEQNSPLAVNGYNHSKEKGEQQSTFVNTVAPDKPAETKPIRNYVPRGSVAPILKLLASSPQKVFSSKAVTEAIQAKSHATVSSTLSDLAQQDRIGRGTPSGYCANEETIRIVSRLS